MNLLEAITTAFSMIRAHKLRAFFTVLGTMMGVTFLIAVVTLITGMDAYMKEDFAGKIYGFNSVMLRQRPSVVMNVDEETWRSWQRRQRLTFEDAAWLEERIETPGILSINSEGGGQVEGPDGTLLESVRIAGASASYFRARDMGVDQGRVFSDQEAERGLPIGGVCHGPLGLHGARTPDGRPLVEGRRISCVTDKQVQELGIASTPYHPESALRERGAVIEARHRFRDPFANHWVVDGNLVTGQNQNAGPMVARELLMLVPAAEPRSAR